MTIVLRIGLLALLALLAAGLLKSPAPSRAEGGWTREGLDGREVRSLVLGTDGRLLALAGTPREPSPLWLQDAAGWRQPLENGPGFVLTLAPLPDGGLLLGAGRDIADQPGVFLVDGNPPTSQRLYDAQAIGVLAVGTTRPQPAIYAASAPWADRDAGADLLRRDPFSGTWSTVHQESLNCGDGRAFFKQITTAGADSERVYALEWCFDAVVRQTQLWRSDDQGESWQPLQRAQYPPAGFLAVDPIDPDVIYLALVGSGSELIAGLERSLDGGLTWSRVGHLHEGLNGARALVVDPRQPARLVATTERGGVVESADHGETWHPLPGLEGLRVHALALDDERGLLYAATADGVWRWPLP